MKLHVVFPSANFLLLADCTHKSRAGWVEARNPTSFYPIILLGFASLYPAYEKNRYRKNSPAGWARLTTKITFGGQCQPCKTAQPTKTYNRTH